MFIFCLEQKVKTLANNQITLASAIQQIEAILTFNNNHAPDLNINVKICLWAPPMLMGVF